MASLRVIRGRLRSIQSTKQIMRAMQLVSGSKLKRAQARLMQARLVLEFLDGLVERVVAAAPALAHPLTAQRTGTTALVIFTSDTGLAGSYNTNLIQLADAYLRRDTARTTRVIYIGKKGYRYFTKRGFRAEASYLDLAGRPDLKKADQIGRALMRRFLDGQVSEIKLLYSRFISAMVYRPTVATWLPITPPPAAQAPGPAAQSARPPGPPGASAGAGGVRERRAGEYIFEPSAERVFEALLPRWALAKFQLVMLEAFTSEHSARMIAMKNATDNAEELLQNLTRERNKIRQASITKEISEITGTAEALK